MREISSSSQGRVGIFARSDRALILAPHLAGVDVIYQAPVPQARTSLDRLRAAAGVHEALGIAPPKFDAAQYVGTRPKFSASPPTDDWIAEQKRAHLLVARTDSGYIPANAPTSHIAEILQSAGRSQEKHSIPVEAVVAFASEWLTHRASELSDVLHTATTPVSLLVAHTRDPFGTRKAVAGLVQVLAATDVRVDRSDVSAIGALVVGARPGTIGAAASLRHVYPPGSSSGPTSGVPSVFVVRLMAWKTLDYVRLASEQLGRDEVWRCDCPICRGMRIGDAIRTDDDAALHNFYATTGLANAIFSSPSPLESFRGRIQEGQWNSHELERLLGGSWAPQSFLGAWLSALPAPSYA